MSTKNLKIKYINGTCDIFSEENLDCTCLTLKGHAAELVDAWSKKAGGVHKIDHYNAVLIDQIISVGIF